MNKETLTALKGSIEKWEAIVEGTGIDGGYRNCPLCTLFIDDNCRECPTKCSGSFPYGKWESHVDNEHWAEGTLKIYCPTCKELAQAELDHLKSLLPKE
ncbi:MAG TPA: hypothetical protein ENI07_11030 [Desulfobacterales bacterium]|nr:hypothetical protein [Desulfobacterales bacterium]